MLHYAIVRVLYVSRVKKSSKLKKQKRVIKMNTYEITKTDNILTFARDHCDCYGNTKKTHIDTEGKTGKSLYAHIKKHAGVSFAISAKDNGYC